MDAQLVLDTTDINAAVTLVVDEHGQTATVACACLAAGKDQMDVAVAIGDEALGAVQSPAVVLLVVRGTEHDALQVRPCIGLGEVHGHCLAGTYTGNVLLPLLLAAKAVQGLYAVLQGPYILESRIGCRNHLVGCRIYGYRYVQTIIATWHGYAVQSGLNHCLQVLVCLFGITHTAVLAMGTFGIDCLGIGRHNVFHYVGDDVQETVIAVHCVCVILRGVGITVLVGIVALLQLYNPRHQRTVLKFKFDLFAVHILLTSSFVCNTLSSWVGPPRPFR